MEPSEFPILEFDEDRHTIMDPGEYTEESDIPEHIVLCYFFDVVASIAEEQSAKTAATLNSEMGFHPLFEITHQGKRVAFMQPGVGAPMSGFSAGGTDLPWRQELHRMRGSWRAWLNCPSGRSSSRLRRCGMKGLRITICLPSREAVAIPRRG